MAGALASYGVDVTSHFRPAADDIDRILKGEKPANLPVQAPTRFELVTFGSDDCCNAKWRLDPIPLS